MVSIAAQITPSAGMPSLKDKATRLDMFGGMRLDLGGILGTGAYADFEIKCGKHAFKVHKAILRSASPFFQAAIEGITKENEDSALTMSNDEPAIIARLLIFIYPGTHFSLPLSTWKDEHTCPFSSVSDPYRKATSHWQIASKLAIAMYQIADMTFINPLRWDSRNRFLSAVRPDRTTEKEGQTFWSIDEMQEVSGIFILVYDSTRADDWMLHDPIVRRMLIGMQEHGCVKWEHHHSLLEEVPRLVLEIATSQFGSRRNAPKCGRCGKKTPQKLWRCSCGQMEDCNKEECGGLRRLRYICDSCAKFWGCL